jgi:hypothetical protein
MRSLPRTIIPLLLLAAIIAFPKPGSAQTQLVSDSFFPADLEFGELRRVREDYSGAKAAAVPPAELRLLDEAGYGRYARRVYDVSPKGTLSVEVVTAKDERAAYSLFSLLRKEGAQAGSPGDWHSIEKDTLSFCRGNYWVRLRASDLADLMGHVAVSVSNRIGPRQPKTPSLISHLPAPGLDISSIKYFLGDRSFTQYSGQMPGLAFKFSEEMEVVQAAYGYNNQAGILSLISFPTAQMAQEYFDQAPDSAQSVESRVYTRRVGPLVGILAGGFDVGAADSILGGIKFSYTVKWIYDKNNNSSRTLWGVPVKILGTVVRSLVLTALLCFGSIFFGAGFAVFRLILRDYAPGNYFDRPERTEMIRLRLNEETLAEPADKDQHPRGR